MDRVHTRSFDLKCLKEPFLLLREILDHAYSFIQWQDIRKWGSIALLISHLKNKVIRDLNLHSHVLIQEFKLIAEIMPDNFFINSHVWKSLASFLKNNFELFCSKARVLQMLKRGITAKHLEIHMLPTAADSCKLSLALLNREKLHNYFK